MEAQQINSAIGQLVDRWCERRDLSALAGILPAWLGNSGLTDGYEELATALRSVSNHTYLPHEERVQLKQLWVEVDFALRNR